jgi:glycosyltransferase involved in cell wall biosynthesis
LAKYGLSRNKWIDYMYAGKPIICSYSGFQSMINEANSGSFVPYADADALSDEIMKYYKLPKNELESLGQNAKKYILENRSFTALAEEYLKFL